MDHSAVQRAGICGYLIYGRCQPVEAGFRTDFTRAFLRMYAEQILYSRYRLDIYTFAQKRHICDLNGESSKLSGWSCCWTHTLHSRAFAGLPQDGHKQCTSRTLYVHLETIRELKTRIRGSNEYIDTYSIWMFSSSKPSKSGSGLMPTFFRRCRRCLWARGIGVGDQLREEGKINIETGLKGRQHRQKYIYSF